MLDLVALRNHLRGLGLAGHRAGERLLCGAIIVILGLLVVGRIPMDEDPDADEEIVRLGFRNDAFGDAVGDRLSHRVLRRPEHLHGLLGALDGHLVEQNRRGLGEQIRSDHREQRGEAFLVVRQRMRECGFGCASARSDQQIDVGDLVAVADERFTDAEFRDLRHLPTLLPRKSDASPTGHVSVDRHNGYPCCQRPAGDAGPVSRIAAEARPARQSQSLLQADGKMFRSRFANSVATVRSALVPGLTERCFSDRSYASSSGRISPGSRAASSRSRKCAAERRTSSAVSAPCSRTIWLSQNAEAKPRNTASVAHLRSLPRARAAWRTGSPSLNTSSKSDTYCRAMRSRSAASAMACRNVTCADPNTSCRSAPPRPPGAAATIARNASLASATSSSRSTRASASRKSAALCSAAAARGAHSRMMPRLVLWPTAARAASTAAKMRRPTRAPGTVSGAAAASALRRKSSGVLRPAGDRTCTFPGLGASSSSRQEAANAAAMRSESMFTRPLPARPGRRERRRGRRQGPRQCWRWRLSAAPT